MADITRYVADLVDAIRTASPPPPPPAAHPHRRGRADGKDPEAAAR